MELTSAERAELTRRAKSRTGRAEDARRAQVVLMLVDGHTWDEVCDRLDCSRGFVASWSKRFAEQRLSGLYSRHRGQVATRLTPRLEARILDATRKKPTDGTTHWSTRRLAAKLGVSHMMIARVWARHGLKPHRLERYMASTDPDFEACCDGNAASAGSPEPRLERMTSPHAVLPSCPNARDDGRSSLRVRGCTPRAGPRSRLPSRLDVRNQKSRGSTRLSAYKPQHAEPADLMGP